VHLVIHPILPAKRDKAGNRAADGAAVTESCIQIHINEQTSAERLKEIRGDLEQALADVRAAVEDWRKMKERCGEAIASLASPPRGLPADEVAEARAFLEWVADDHFTFLGYREYDFSGVDDSATLSIAAGSGLGVLRDDAVSVFDGLRNFEKLPPEVRFFLRQPRALMITKANRRATVHRAVHLDTIGIKKFDGKGQVIGEQLFVGLLTSAAYSQSPREIPLLRRKVADCVKRAGFAPASHDGKALQHILETYPRDELFQIGDDELYAIGLGILQLQERQRIALFARRDPFERFVSCLVYVPRDRYNTDFRLRIQDILARAYKGRFSSVYTHMTDAPLVRLHMIVATAPGTIPDVDADDIERQIVEAGRSWTDQLQEVLIEARGEENGLTLMRRFGDAFPAGYRERFMPTLAVLDIEHIETALGRDGIAMNLYRAVEAGPQELRLKLYNAGAQISLSDILPILENMGLRVLSEEPYRVKPRDSEKAVWLHDFSAVTADGRECDLGAVRRAFEEALSHVWRGDMEDDGFNRLVLGAGLDWRAVAMLRAYCKYLRQAGVTFSQDYMEDALAGNAGVAVLLAQLFRAMFDPAGAATAEQRAAQVAAEIEAALDAVTNLDEDRILRRYLNAIQSTLRTNFFQKAADDGVKPYISFKLDSRAIVDLPLPRPLYEIFVYSPRVEAIHLRGGKVARGGIRWSDRREDFRTEILGLLKAQMVKNAVIVPTGSKGGFVVKRPPATGGREALMAEVVESYKTMMRGLLDITDNLAAGAVKPPADVIRRDGDDPYLVVAADKGTATFSDIANGVSKDYGFWLGDAFASGGSAGYDHKGMGITARGAWEAAKRHFRELGTDIQAQDFTCVGVGDMAGDVFGNGMLLSKHTKLVAAFNHLHIFLDPDPDPAASWQERKRLFDQPRSAWSDYDAKAISVGGGVFERGAKSIKLSPQAKQRFAIAENSLTPAELIQRLLKAEVDLLWLGGIGTFVKASDESSAEAGDRANDALRINAADLRCKVVGEGANLGFTQRGRIEYALKGGRINTDAIDNSAGVDTSDHEVNIKILLNEMVAAGDMTLKQRDKLLAQMTDEVGRLVLRDNYLQTQALSLTEAQAPALLGQHARFMRGLERAGRLNRAVEFLPGTSEIARREAAGQGLTRPELAVLLAYAKTTLNDELLPSDLPDDPQLLDDLLRYFPAPLQASYKAEIAKHRLRREIIATVVTNSLVNRAGPAFVFMMKENTGMAAPAIARAYAITRGVFGLRDIWGAIEALDNKAPAATQAEMLIETTRLAESGTSWFLRNGEHPLDIAANIAAFAPGIKALLAAKGIVSPQDRSAIDARAKAFAGQGAPADLAELVATLRYLAPCLDVVRIAKAAKQPVESVGRAYFAAGDRLGLEWLRGSALALAAESHWQRLAISAVIEDLFAQQRDLATRMLRDRKGNGKFDGPELVADWLDGRAAVTSRLEGLLGELRQSGTVDLAMLTVASREIRSLLER
jgi:glutamate dehydrogenase